ncbi:tRNA (adenosine(37)-N6)-dimethylallyltransferase MiaA [Streptococcus halichoeri]|uniref:tRNA (adenosine(37)-N6)-dimethylallyltransferase MiaA n=1 Tax=Streptococcus halichoeri TaxID=254785 RepID=UPI0013583B74|nr:tRNA (adenosine(37)-N6)-dimethylallyltransferase MiaA [Streptococcus halichoeri]
MTVKEPRKKLIAVVGPTAVGKTALGIELAKTFNGEIISGDSQQVYKGLDIGTAKASAREQALVKHHLIDIREPWENYSVYDFVQDATRALDDIMAAGKLPIIVGGTGLYIQSLIEGYHLGGEVDQAALLAYRAALSKLTNQQLYQQVKKARIYIPEPNRRRAIRALERHRFATKQQNKPFPYEVLLLGLTDERASLYERINQRVDGMVEQGLLAEAEDLFTHFPHAQVSRAIGYKELFPYFAGEASLDAALAQLKQNSRRFAKRQLTWFRNRMAVPFYQISEPTYPAELVADAQAFLTKNPAD